MKHTFTGGHQHRLFHFQHYSQLQLYQPLIKKSNWLTKPFQNQAVNTETRSESAVWLEFSKNHFTLVTLEQIWRSYILRSQMALQSVIKIDHTFSISISIWVVDQSLAHDQQKVIKRSNRSRSAIESPSFQKRDLNFCWTNSCIKIKTVKFSSCLLNKKANWIFSGQSLKTKIRKFASRLPGKSAIWIFLDSHLKSKFINLPATFSPKKAIF